MASSYFGSISNKLLNLIVRLTYVSTEICLKLILMLQMQGKMRNHLAINVLNYKMLHLMKEIQNTLAHPEILQSTIDLLEHTAIYVDIFCNSNSKLESMNDTRIQKLLKILDFFHTWEQEFCHPERAIETFNKQTDS